MPELPDVEIFRRYFASKALNRKIKDIKVMSRLTLDKKNSEEIGMLKNSSFTEVTRHGKNLFAHASNGLYLTMHFGMTGFLADFIKRNPFKEHTRALIHFDNGHTLAFVDARQLGRIAVIESIEKYLKRKKLGQDALEISVDDFRSIFEDAGQAKAIFLDQHKMAGVGNVYADEILFQAKMHPKKTHLDSKDVASLYKSMGRVLNGAIRAQANIDKMPSTWIIPHRKKNEPCPKCGTPIHQTTVSTRPTYYCPKCQPFD